MSSGDFKSLSEQQVQDLQDVANKMRIHSIEMTEAANSGHPTSSASAAEIVALLFFNEMRYTTSFPKDPSSDRFVLSKGHACPILYAAWCEAGLLSVEDLKTLRKVDSILEGHPTPRQNYIDVATGSLGQGLGVSAGMAYCGKYIEKASYRVYCLMGDGEVAEGSVWEAASFASYYKLDNLVAIVDVNRLGQSQPTALQHDMETYRKRFDGFGFNAIVVDGHDIRAVYRALQTAKVTKDRPTALLCQTLKGKGFPDVEDKENWHGKPLGPKEAKKSIDCLNAQIKTPGPIKFDLPEVVHDTLKIESLEMHLSEPPKYKEGEKVATRKAYGTALVKLGNTNAHLIALDGDTKNSTFAITYRDKFPDRFVECFIAEQNMVGVAIGLACRDRNVVFCSAFAAFFTRAFDQIRMGAISQTKANFVGSHAGCSIGEDGPSQMALEDLAMFRTVPGSVVFYPSDAVSTERAIELAANYQGVTFTRTSRPETTILYKSEEHFEIGGAKVIRQSDQDQVTVVGAGITLFEALKAYDELAKENIKIRVVDPFTIKPIDKKTLLDCAKATGGKIVTVEDHYPEGGIGEAVAGALSEETGVRVHRLAVTGIPRSGLCNELLELYGINYKYIVKAVKELIQ